MTTTPIFNTWVKCSRPNSQANLRLFCFPYAGGGTWSFRDWSDDLPDTIEVCSIELPGRGTQMKSPPFTQLQPLVCAIADALRLYLDKPFAFFGHSMGGLVSFEVARLLRKHHGLMPVHLFVSGRRAPQLQPTKPPIHNLPKPEFIEELKQLNGTPSEVLKNHELMELMLPILRADFAVLETYNYSKEKPLSCPIAVFGGLQDSEVSHEELQAWREQTSSEFSLQMFQGDHFFINFERQVLLQLIAQKLIKYS
ncbi:MAG: thioesterase [Hydrococcus sp. RU_2_2]|jgi:medium-chain acyl-[acyl-carrier-protein] hydrolase|nr:thioesterase [Hydrococcus sp. RU_2_2]NJP18568.1 thioesterase [Hydrococcus sp. CRU_1_1]